MAKQTEVVRVQRIKGKLANLKNLESDVDRFTKLAEAVCKRTAKSLARMVDATDQAVKSVAEEVAKI